RVPKSVNRGFEDELREVEESVLPMAKIVAIVVHVPDVGHVLLLQVSVDALADANEAVFVAAGNPQQLQLAGWWRRVSEQVRGWLCIRRGRHPSHPSECIQVPESEIQGLAAAHRKPGQGSALALCLHG